MCKEKRYSLHQIFLLLDLYNDMADKVGKKPTKMTLISLRDGTDVRDFETEAQMIGYVKDTQPKKVQNRVLSADWTEVIPGTYRILTSGTLMELHVQQRGRTPSFFTFFPETCRFQPFSPPLLPPSIQFLIFHPKTPPGSPESLRQARERGFWWGFFELWGKVPSQSQE